MRRESPPPRPRLLSWHKKKRKKKGETADAV